jgi:hypothetical protein
MCAELERSLAKATRASKAATTKAQAATTKLTKAKNEAAKANGEALKERVGGASALVTFICILCTLRMQILSINTQLYTLHQP